MYSLEFLFSTVLYFLIAYLQFWVVCWVVIFLASALASLAMFVMLLNHVYISCGLLVVSRGEMFKMLFMLCISGCRC